jgi:hypothetical protein
LWLWTSSFDSSILFFNFLKYFQMREFLSSEFYIAASCESRKSIFFS